MPILKAKQNKERRQKFLECAIELFTEKGYVNTSIREIIARAGFGTGTFYNYFIDKEDILKVLLEEFAEQVISNINSYYTNEKDLYKRFIETKRVTMEVLASNGRLSEIYSRVAGTSEAIDKCLKQFEDKLIETYIRNIEYGINKGTFKNVSVPPIANAILATEKFLLYKWIVLKDITKDEMIEMVISFHETLAKGLFENK